MAYENSPQIPPYYVVDNEKRNVPNQVLLNETQHFRETQQILLNTTQHLDESVNQQLMIAVGETNRQHAMLN